LAVPEDRPVPVPDVFARDDPDLLAVPVLRDFEVPLVEREVPAPEAFVPLLRDDDDFFGPDDAVELLLAEPVEPRPLPELPDELELPLLSLDHLPLMTRCAASATASAMIEPSLVALDSMLPAARSAVSAASRPASRIFFRAAGLALIAAAAAASPAASISLLIAALASLSTVSLPDLLDELDEVDREEFLLGCFATCLLPRFAEKDTCKPFRFPNEVEVAQST
jgi:hypothetical protein